MTKEELAERLKDDDERLVVRFFGKGSKPMTETWCPKENDVVKVINDQYSGCNERPLLNQRGRVKTIWDYEGEKVLVIAFTAAPANNPTKIKGGTPKTIFNEYFAVSRKPYLYFEPCPENWKD